MSWLLSSPVSSFFLPETSQQVDQVQFNSVKQVFKLSMCSSQSQSESNGDYQSDGNYDDDEKKIKRPTATNLIPSERNRKKTPHIFQSDLDGNCQTVKQKKKSADQRYSTAFNNLHWERERERLEKNLKRHGGGGGSISRLLWRRPSHSPFVYSIFLIIFLFAFVFKVVWRVSGKDEIEVEVPHTPQAPLMGLINKTWTI